MYFPVSFQPGHCSPAALYRIDYEVFYTLPMANKQIIVTIMMLRRILKRGREL
jgi:hypothetical protein